MNASMQMVKSTEVNSYFIEGRRWYKSWLGVPWARIPLLDATSEWFDYEFRGLERQEYAIAEIGPNGGMWTRHMLLMMQRHGIADRMNYSLFGTEAELGLTLRDAVQLFDRDISYNYWHRVRTYPLLNVPEGVAWPHLMSSVKFSANDLEDWGSENTRFNTIICFDTIADLGIKRAEVTLNAMARRLAQGGSLILNIPREHHFGAGRFRDLGFGVIGFYHEVESDMYYYRFSR